MPPKARAGRSAAPSRSVGPDPARSGTRQKRLVGRAIRAVGQCRGRHHRMISGPDPVAGTCRLDDGDPAAGLGRGRARVGHGPVPGQAGRRGAGRRLGQLQPALRDPAGAARLRGDPDRPARGRRNRWPVALARALDGRTAVGLARGDDRHGADLRPYAGGFRHRADGRRLDPGRDQDHAIAIYDRVQGFDMAGAGAMSAVLVTISLSAIAITYWLSGRVGRRLA